MTALNLDLGAQRPLSRQSSRPSISELGSSVGSTFSLADIEAFEKNAVTSKLVVLASPNSVAKADLAGDTTPVPPKCRSRSPLSLGSSVPGLGLSWTARRGSGPAELVPRHFGSAAPAGAPNNHSSSSSSAASPMPHQPNRIYSQDEVYEELRRLEEEDPKPSRASSNSASPKTCRAGMSSLAGGQADTAEEQEEGGVVELSDDVLLPFVDRVTEAKENLLSPFHKGIADLLKSDQRVWPRLMNLFDIPRDVMCDQVWITELKSLVYPKGESLWHRLAMAFGIDAEDAAVTPNVEPSTTMWVEPLLHGDHLLENDKANGHRKDHPPTDNGFLSPEQETFSMDLSISPRSTSQVRFNEPPRSGFSPSSRHHRRTHSGGSMRSGSSLHMPSIAEDLGPGGDFLEPTEPPKKLNFELLAEQERLLAEAQTTMPANFQVHQKGASPPQSFIPPSVDTAELGEDCDAGSPAADRVAGFDTGVFSKESHRRSSTDSPGRRMRGLRFVTCTTKDDPNLPLATPPAGSAGRGNPFSKSFGSVSDYAVESESDWAPGASGSPRIGGAFGGPGRAPPRIGLGALHQRGPALLV